MSASSPYPKVGILGGGQLGKMLVLAAAPLDLPIYILDSSKDVPAASHCYQFVAGSFKDYEDVYQFGKDLDIISIEIEHVNTDALRALLAEGKTVHPHPDKLDIIKDKGLQKLFYREHGLPTAAFELYEDDKAILEALKNGSLQFPFVQKSRTAGYDGQGVVLIHSEADLDNLLPVASMVEDLVDLDQEIAVQIARNESREIVAFPPVGMEFHPTANLVEFLYCPANLEEATSRKATELAIATMKAYDLCGLLSVELFLDKSGELYINEVAPRTHNSGHHTIEAVLTSQFQQQLRAILNWPLGPTDIVMPAVMVNLLGAEGYKGPVRYEGLQESLQSSGVY
ncbi:MAG: ATP-grasp domain-containing protein, partial [Bacteroidota bacterium]